MNWQEPGTITKVFDVSAYLTVFLYGSYIWEFFSSFWFELSFLRKNVHERQSFQWPHVFYFAARYAILAFLTGLTVSLSLQNSQANCQTITTFNAIMGNTAIWCSTASLMSRTVVLSMRKHLVKGMFGILTLGHCIILYRSALNITTRPQQDVILWCNEINVNPLWVELSLFYTIAFDIGIFIFMVVTLSRGYYSSNQTLLWRKLYRDGILYVIISITANVVPIVLNIIDLNPPMNVIATIPAAVITSVVSGRLVLSLIKYGKLHLPQPNTPTFTTTADQSTIPIQVEGPSNTASPETITLEIINPAGTSNQGKNEARTDIDVETSSASVSNFGPYKVFEE